MMTVNNFDDESYPCSIAMMYSMWNLADNESQLNENLIHYDSGQIQLYYF